MKTLLRKPIILPVIVLTTLAIMIILVKNKPNIEHEPPQFPRKTVEIITAKTIPFRNQVTAYGNVEPAILLKVRSEISGKVSYIHRQLKGGASLNEGTLVLAIEPTTFKFSIDQSEAILSGNQSSLTQLETEERSTKRLLEIAKKNMLTGEKELNRLLSIWEKRLIARSVIDAEEQKVLQLRQGVEDISGKLSGFSSRKSVAAAHVNQSKSQLEKSRDALGRTEFLLPFDARIGQVFVEEGEYVAIGSVLFEALGTKSIEVVAELPLSQFYPLVMGMNKTKLNLEKPEDFQNTVSELQLDAKINLVGSSARNSSWQAKFIRISESINPTRDTIALVVTVPDPYKNVVPGRRPPLIKGMYVAVQITGPVSQQIVLPRRAIHEGRVYVAGADNTLKIKPVDILHKQGELVTILAGLNEGEKVIITDVVPVIEGLPLNVIYATKAEAAMALAALATESQTLASKLSLKK